MLREHRGRPESCDNCGACCMHMGTPPGYAAFFQIDGDEQRGREFGEEMTGVRLSDVPHTIMTELADYYRAVWAGEIPDRTANDDTPCLWLDLDTRRCKHYEHRPSVCRDFAIGEPACHAHRERVGITFNGVLVS